MCTNCSGCHAESSHCKSCTRFGGGASGRGGSRKHSSTPAYRAKRQHTSRGESANSHAKKNVHVPKKVKDNNIDVAKKIVKKLKKSTVGLAAVAHFGAALDAAFELQLQQILTDRRLSRGSRVEEFNELNTLKSKTAAALWRGISVLKDTSEDEIRKQAVRKTKSAVSSIRSGLRVQRLTGAFQWQTDHTVSTPQREYSGLDLLSDLYAIRVWSAVFENPQLCMEANSIAEAESASCLGIYRKDLRKLKPQLRIKQDRVNSEIDEVIEQAKNLCSAMEIEMETERTEERESLNIADDYSRLAMASA